MLAADNFTWRSAASSHWKTSRSNSARATVFDLLVPKPIFSQRGDRSGIAISSVHLVLPSEVCHVAVCVSVAHESRQADWSRSQGTLRRRISRADRAAVYSV